MTIATFAAGCFWGVEAKFRQVNGVISTRVGYTAGTTDNPDYKAVCTGTTGHAEAIEVTFDPAVISYTTLLEVFWRIHNPTTLNIEVRSSITMMNSGNKHWRLNKHLIIAIIILNLRLLKLPRRASFSLPKNITNVTQRKKA